MADIEAGEQWVPLTSDGGQAESPDDWAGDAAMALRPRSAPEMLDLGAEVMVARLMACVGVCILIWFPLRAVMPWFVDVLNAEPNVQEAGELLTFLGAIIGLSAVQTLAAVISTTSVTLIVYLQMVGQPISAVEALRRTLRRIFALVGVFLINVLAISISGGLLVGLGIFCPPLFLGALAVYLYLTWKFSVAPSALVLEDLGVIASIKRSWELTSGSFLRWVGIMVLAQCLVAGFGAGLQLGDNVILRDGFLEWTSMPSWLFNVIFVGISSVFSGVAMAVNSSAMTAFYIDSRIRREGFDLTMRLDRLRAQVSPAVESTP